MAGRGPARRAAGAVADQRNGQQPVKAVLSVTVPAKPRGLTAPVRRAWDDFWASDVAVLLQRSDLHAVRRLFQLYAERETCHAEVTDRKTTRLPLDVAVDAGLVGTVEYELVGETNKAFLVFEHDGRVALGSQGQLVLSPYAKDLRTIDAEIRQLEDRFGLSVRARAALAVTVRPPAPPQPDQPGPLSATGDEADRDLLDL